MPTLDHYQHPDPGDGMINDRGWIKSRM